MMSLAHASCYRAMVGHTPCGSSSNGQMTSKFQWRTYALVQSAWWLPSHHCLEAEVMAEMMADVVELEL